jgi:hypothetical protein
MKRLLFAALLALFFTPLGGESASAHGCHRDARYGQAGLHFHVGSDCDRVAGRRSYRGRHDRDDDRRCAQRCRYIGPIKTCERVCR